MTPTVEVYSQRAQGGPLYCVRYGDRQLGDAWLTCAEASARCKAAAALLASEGEPAMLAAFLNARCPHL